MPRTGMHKVTALADVRFLANVAGEKMEEVMAGVLGKRPCETRQWVSLGKGESRDDINLIFGIDPDCLPREPVLILEGERFVKPSALSPLPITLFGLLRVEGAKQ